MHLGRFHEALALLDRCPERPETAALAKVFRNVIGRG
jgi:hypothetical protein